MQKQIYKYKHIHNNSSENYVQMNFIADKWRMEERQIWDLTCASFPSPGNKLLKLLICPEIRGYPIRKLKIKHEKTSNKKYRETRKKNVSAENNVKVPMDRTWKEA